MGGIETEGAVMSSLREAIRYRRLKLSSIPIHSGRKTPAIKSWKEYTESLPSERDLRAQYEANPKCGVALVMGRVSQGLGCRDFDELISYQIWKKHHADLAKKLPTVETGKGMHVYFRLTEDLERVVRICLGKPKSKGAIKFSDGELRIGNCYCVAPPSRHVSGKTYKWLVPLRKPPIINPIEAGLGPRFTHSKHSGEGVVTNTSPDATSVQRVQSDQKTCPLGTLDSLEHSEQIPVNNRQVGAAIERCIPGGFHQRHDALFRLARELKGIPICANSKSELLKTIVRAWHAKSLNNIQTKSLDESWRDFQEAWDKVKFAVGDEPKLQIIKKALTLPPPQCSMQFEDDVPRKLLSICRELQHDAGDQEFFLASRTAAKIIYPEQEIENARSNITRWLAFFVKKGTLEKTFQGSPKNGKANRYRYYGD